MSQNNQLPDDVSLGFPSITHDFMVTGGDTDSISFCKKDQTPFTDEEYSKLLAEINGLMPEKVLWEDDGRWTTQIYFGAKNYVLYNKNLPPGKQKKTKGSASKDSKKERALAEFQAELVKAVLDGTDNYKEIYERYVIESQNVKDISRWASKKTYTKALDVSQRTNETKIKDAIAGSEYQPGDKFYTFYKSDDTLCLVERFDGDYNKTKFLAKLHKCTKLFDGIIDTKALFINYSLKNKKVKAALEELLSNSWS